MEASPSAAARRESRDETSVLRQYYLDHDVFLSSEGILKVVSIFGCIVAAALFLGGAGCARAPGVLPGGAGAALGAAPLGLPLLAPQTFFYTDIIVSSVAGVLLLLTGVLSLTVCEPGGALDYAHGPLAMTMAATVMLSAGLTYAAAMRYWDAAWRERARPPRARALAPTHTLEHDV